MVPGIDPRIDYAFKRLFGVERNRDLLIDLLNAVLDPPDGQAIVDVELLNPFHPRSGNTDKLSIVDVKARDQTGRIFIVEMQMLVFADLPQRLLYYWSAAYFDQLRPGQGYGELRPTILIAFLNQYLFPGDSPGHCVFRLADSENKLRFTDDLEIHTIELPKFQSDVSQIASPIDAWTWFLRHAERLDRDQLPAPLTIPPFRHAMDELAMIAENEQDRMEYLSQRLAVMDEQARTKDSLLRGELIGRVRVFQRWLRQPESRIEDFADSTLAELRTLAESLERQVEEMR